jgi:hypothetical protein
MQGNPLTPEGCRPECIRQDDCATNLACINQRCHDPCPGTCGIDAQCVVQVHNPYCSCPPGFVGDPFVRCTFDKRPPPENNPCNPSPCGSNTVCTFLDGGPVCDCMNENYIGNPNIGCKPECVLNTECPSTQACINMKCTDPCPGTCGLYAECRVVNHRAVCTCLKGYQGDPFRQCHPQGNNIFNQLVHGKIFAPFFGQASLRKEGRNKYYSKNRRCPKPQQVQSGECSNARDVVKVRNLVTPCPCHAMYFGRQLIKNDETCSDTIKLDLKFRT